MKRKLQIVKGIHQIVSEKIRKESKVFTLEIVDNLWNDIELLKSKSEYLCTC